MREEQSSDVGWAELLSQAMAGDVAVIVVLLLAAAVVGWVLGKAKVLLLVLGVALVLGVVAPEPIFAVARSINEGLLGAVNQGADNVRDMGEEHGVPPVSGELDAPPPQN